MCGSKDSDGRRAPGRRAFLYRDKLSVGVIMTGGTIAMTYDPRRATLGNTEPVVRQFAQALRAEDMDLEFVDLMHRDSVTMEDGDYRKIGAAVAEMGRRVDAILVTHGTERMARSAEFVAGQADLPHLPIVFTGAMIPITLTGSDAQQNVTEALFALRILPPGVFVVFHNRVLPVPGAVKDRVRMTFALARQDDQLEPSHEHG